MAEHFVVSGVFSLMEVSFPNLGTSSVQVDVSQICCVPDNVFMITSSNVEEGTLQCRLRLVKTLVKEIMMVESSIQIHSFFGMLFDGG